MRIAVRRFFAAFFLSLVVLVQAEQGLHQHACKGHNHSSEMDSSSNDVAVKLQKGTIRCLVCEFNQSHGQECLPDAVQSGLHCPAMFHEQRPCHHLRHGYQVFLGTWTNKGPPISRFS